MKLSIVVLTPGPSEGKVIPVSIPEFVIGRDPQCQLRSASALVGNRHCALLQRQGKVFVRDIESPNGILLNDRQMLRGEIEILDGDRLRVGPLLFALRLEGAPAVSRPTPLPPTKAATQLASSAPAQETASQETTPQPSSEKKDDDTASKLPAAPSAAADKDKSRKGAADTSRMAGSLLKQYIKKLREE
jgi:predicted component of type VI protein secretion system